VLNPRWSLECAAHDQYEQLNDTLASSEDPTAAGYSAGGAWAGLGSDLAQGKWTAAVSPWREAPVSLLALLAPSLSVTGIDDSPTRQCAVTFPGMLRTPPGRDTIHTVPAGTVWIVSRPRGQMTFRRQSSRGSRRTRRCSSSGCPLRRGPVLSCSSTSTAQERWDRRR
jgi:hypothetical protein